MNERTRSSWAHVGETVEGLALKLKMHAEQARGRERDDVEGAIEAVRLAVESAFGTLHAAVADPAVQADVQSVASGLGDAIAVTLSDVRKRMSGDGTAAAHEPDHDRTER
jgi:hypothetical protein